MLEELELRRLRPCRMVWMAFGQTAEFISTASVQRASNSQGEELEQSALTSGDTVEVQDSTVVGM